MGSVMLSQLLVLPTNKYGRKNVTSNKQQQEDIVLFRMPGGIEDAEQDQADGTDNSENDCESGQDLFARGGVGYQSSLVAEPSIGKERNIEEDGGQDASRHEKGFEVRGADV